MKKYMKKYLSFVLACLMVLSSVAFAAPVAVGTVETTKETTVDVTEVFNADIMEETETDTETVTTELAQETHVFCITFDNLDTIANSQLVSTIATTYNIPSNFPEGATYTFAPENATFSLVTDETDSKNKFVNVVPSNGYSRWKLTSSKVLPYGTYRIVQDLKLAGSSNKSHNVSLFDVATSNYLVIGKGVEIGTEFDTFEKEFTYNNETCSNYYNLDKSEDGSKEYLAYRASGFQMYLNNLTVKWYVDNINIYYTPESYTVTFSGKGAVPEAIEVVKNGYFDPSEFEPKYLPETASEFLGWSLEEDGEVLTEPIEISEDTTLYAVYEKVDMYDDTYGHLLYYIDFETDIKYAAKQPITDQGIVNSNFEGSDKWIINIYAQTHEKITDNGNTFMRMTNLTGKDGTQFNVWSRDTHEDGVFTSENGYYTVFADVRADTSSGEAGDDFSHMWNQPFHVVGGTAESSSSAKFNLTEEFTTKEMLLYREGAEGLRRHRYIFNYTTGATKAGVDKFDIDNLKMYFKPLSVDVTVLAGDNADFEAQKVTVAIDKDTLNSTITKAKLMALVENDTDLVLGDLTLSDGSAFEEIDVMKVTEVKAVWLSKAPQSYDVSSIRVKDPSGIRFKASVSDVLRANESLTEYGFIVTLKDLLGETDVNDFTHKTEVSKVEGKSYSKEENIDKVFATENSLTFFTAVLYNMPETQYARDVVVRPYTVVNDEYVYGDAMVNNIKAVAEKLQQDPEKYVGDVKIAVDKILAGEKL